MLLGFFVISFNVVDLLPCFVYPSLWFGWFECFFLGFVLLQSAVVFVF